MTFLHRLRHLIHMQPIEVVSEWRLVGSIEHPGFFQIWIGAKCVICGEVSGWEGTQTIRLLDEPPPADYRIMTIERGAD